MTTDLILSISIDNLLIQRESVRRSLEISRKELASADLIVGAIEQGSRRSSLWRGVANLVCNRDYAHGFTLLADGAIEAAMKAFDAVAWQRLMRESGLRSLMDATAREKWDKSIEARDTPELTRANIYSTFTMLHEGRAEMFERGVISCFQRLSWRHKTNQPQKFGKRIIMTSLTGSYGHKQADELDDLMRVFHVLDGKPEADHRAGVYAMLSGAGATSGGTAGQCENDYLRIKFFKNTNGHIEFKRLDLVQALNRIIAKHYPDALPPPK